MNEVSHEVHALERWTKAIVHVEGVSRQPPSLQGYQRVDELLESISTAQGQPTPEAEEFLNILNDMRSRTREQRPHGK